MDSMNGTRDASRVRSLLGKRGLRRVHSRCVVPSYFLDNTLAESVSATRRPNHLPVIPIVLQSAFPAPRLLQRQGPRMEYRARFAE
jgi:hypothetical protein